MQPVHIRVNKPSTDVPAGGRLAEVTVPFTDATWWPNSVNVVAFRLYYNTTHWVSSWELDANGSLWYKLADDKVKSSYYAQASHLRLLPYEELRPISAEVPIAAKRIEVRRSAQVVVAYEWERPVFMARTATGAIFSNGDYTTPERQALHHL